MKHRPKRARRGAHGPNGEADLKIVSIGAVDGTWKGSFIIGGDQDSLTVTGVCLSCRRQEEASRKTGGARARTSLFLRRASPARIMDAVGAGEGDRSWGCGYGCSHG